MVLTSATKVKLRVWELRSLNPAFSNEFKGKKDLHEWRNSSLSLLLSRVRA